MKSVMYVIIAFAAFAGLARGEEFRLLTGLNPGRYPGPARTITPLPGPGSPGTVYDGQRLGGAPSVGPVVTWQGSGTPLYPPNHVGALSFFFKRASIPFVNSPYIGIDFLGGPLLDLDGNPNDAERRLTPVDSMTTPAEIPGSASHIDLTFDLSGGTVVLTAFDATGTNEGGPGVNPGVAVTLNLLADGALNALPAGPINPAFDTRVGTVTPFAGTGGTLNSVYRIENLNVELWYDSIDPFSGSAEVLGTFQHFERLNGWLVRRDANTGQFPSLAGKGLGSTRWPAILTSVVGQSFTTAFDPFDPIPGTSASVTISDGFPADRYPLSGSLGVAMTDFGGDLGAYFDAVVAPLLPAQASGFVYLESSGFGINNTGDPIFGDTIGYDMVVVAASTTTVELPGDVNGDGSVNAADAAALAAALVNPAALTPVQQARADVNDDGSLNGKDVQAWLDLAL